MSIMNINSMIDMIVFDCYIVSNVPYDVHGMPVGCMHAVTVTPTVINVLVCTPTEARAL